MADPKMQEKTRKRRGPYGKRNYDAELQPSGAQDNQFVTRIKSFRTENSMPNSETVQQQATELESMDPYILSEQVGELDFSMDTAIEQELIQNRIDLHTACTTADDDICDFPVAEDDVYPHLGDIESDLEDENLTDPTADEYLDLDSAPLYPGATTTVGAFMLLLAIFTTKYNLAGEATQHLLNIIGFALPFKHKLCSTLHEFKKYFCNLRNPIVHHYYCSFCQGLMEDSTKSTCPYCGKLFNKTKANYFLDIPLKSQIQNLFRQKGIYEHLQHRFIRERVPGLYKDIYDGHLYKSHFDDNGILSDPNNISFTFNTDGASVFKSSNVSVWPVFLVINELPYKIRMKQENMILASLWFGNQKPSMGTFLKPFQQSMKELHDGIECHSPGHGTFTSKGILLCGTADLPARSLLCNHIQYNGAFSCWKCEQEGTSEVVGRGRARVFPYIESSPKGPVRTTQNVLCYAREAVKNQNQGAPAKVIKGIKGPSWLLFFPKFDIVSGIAIDYMHGVLLGVQKMMLELWFLPTYSNRNFNFSCKREILDERLMQIKPTLDITRLPRSIQDLKYWKASEFRSFLLYFGAPILQDILDPERFSHYLLLVNSVYILLKFGSTDMEINKAERLLTRFCQLFEELYDLCFLRLNVHQLMHLPDCVRNLGPLYTHSCFSFEDKNGVLLKMIKGTQCIDQQIVTGVSFVQKLPELKENCVIKGSICEQIYNSIESVTPLKRSRYISDGVYVLGAVNEKTLSDVEHHALIQYARHDTILTMFQSFTRIEFHNHIIYGSLYSRMVRRDNSVIEYSTGEKACFGRVQFFIFFNDETLAFIQKLKCVNYDKDSHILNMIMTDEMEVQNIEQIKSGCMMVTYKGAEKHYVCKFPNKMEND